jgi:hypothetical protein
MDIPKATAIPLLNTISAESVSNYDYSKIKTPLIYGTFIIVMLILISVVVGLIYSKSNNLPDGKILSQKENDTAMMVVAFTIAILLIVFMTIPSYKDFLSFIGKIKFVLLLAGYIIGLIILYRNVPRGIVDAYSFLFFPATMLIGIYLFYLAMEKGQLYGFDLNYERVKYALIYFCLIVFMLLFYTVDPGGYLKTYFGPSLVVTILLAIFGFLYLVTLMTLPTIQGSRATGLPSADASAGGLFKGLTKIGLFSGIGFLIFLIVIVAGILAYPSGFTSGTGSAGSSKTTKVSGIVILLIIIFILWILFFGVLSFSDVKMRDSAGNLDTSMANITKIARQVFMLLFGLIFSGILIGFLVNGVEGLSSQSGIISFILNLVIVLVILVLVFKLVTGGTYYKKSPFFRLIVNTLLYIPCILVGILDPIFSFLGFGAGAAASAGKSGLSGLWHGLMTTIEATKNTPTAYYILLVITILLYVIYFFLGSQVQTNISKQGGTLLVNSTVYTNTENSIGLYDNLNGTSDDNPYNYKYAISFWVFIDAMSPNISSSLNKYTSLLNYGNKPNVLYNASENTIMITLENDGEPAIGSDSRLRNPQDLDASGNIIVYKLPDVLLQKWNNIVINYSNGTLDIFYNGQLMKSVNEAVPQMSKDTLTIGSNGGINGGICNVTYFNTSVTMPQIYYLYNLVKNKNPPVVNSSKESIVKNVLKGANINANPPVITIPINIDVKTAVPDSESYPDKPSKPDESNTKTDYLSFKWFATANNDNFNGV